MNWYTYNVTIGDWSIDGHRITESFRIMTSIDDAGLKEVKKEVLATTGIDIDRLCEEYEDNSLPVEVIDKLNSLGIECEDDYLTPKEYLDIILKLMSKIGDFYYTVLPDDPECYSLRGLGYGLFT